MTGLAEPFVPKEEFTRLKFDPNIRHNLDEIPNSLIHRTLNDGVLPQREPQSMYVAVNYKG